MTIGIDQARELRDKGIRALRGGDPALAQELLAQSVEINPHDEHAWLWLSGAADSDEDRRFCLERALAINPASTAARKGLERLGPAPVTGATVHLASAPAPEPEPAAPEIKHSTYEQPAYVAPVFQGRTQFEFPSWREWKSVWTGAVVVIGGGLIFLLRILLRMGLLASNDGSMHYPGGHPLGIDKNYNIVNSKGFRAKAGSTFVIEYDSTLQGGRPTLMLVDLNYTSPTNLFVWETPLKPGRQRMEIRFDKTSKYYLQIHPNGAKGEVDLSWKFP